MGKVSQLKAGAILSYVTLLIGNLIPLIYTPLMLRIIGPDEHGLYSIAQSVVNYLTLLSFGFGGSIVRYITKYRALEDKENEEKTFGLFMIVYGIFSALVLIVGFVMSLGVNVFFSKTLDGAEFDKMRILLMLMSVNVMITFISTVFSSIIIAHEKFIFNKLLSLVTTILSPCVSIVLLLMGFASVGMTLAATVVNVVSLVGYFIYCLKKLKIKPRFRNLDFNILKEIIKFSAFVFLAELANMLYFATDRVLLGAHVSTVAVSIYTVGATFSNYLNSFTTGISSVLMPRVTSMVFKGASNEEMDDVFIKVGRLQFIIVSFVISAFVVFGRQFMPIFAGEGYGDAYWIAVILMVPLAVPLIQSVAVNIITARNKHLFRSLVLIGVALLNVVLTIAAIWLGWEGIGAALASAIATVVGTIFIMNWYYYKKMGINIPRFWTEILKLCPVPVGMLLVGLGVTHFVDVSGVVRFLIGAVVFTVIYLPLLWIASLNEYEKGLFDGVLNKLRIKSRKGTK